MTERARKGKIALNTRKNHQSTLNALLAFRAVIPFNSLTADFADDFNDYLTRTTPSLNTRWARHKNVKTYLALGQQAELFLALGHRVWTISRRVALLAVKMV